MIRIIDYSNHILMRKRLELKFETRQGGMNEKRCKGDGCNRLIIREMSKASPFALR